jgi:hypothetical protein
MRANPMNIGVNQRIGEDTRVVRGNSDLLRNAGDKKLD